MNVAWQQNRTGKGGKRMDFRKMEAFFTIANTGKFIDAAEKLFISQSSLSKQMSQLEGELGVKLFKKTRSGVQLTQAGQDFYTYVRKALPEYQHELSRLQMYKEESTYPLTVGGLPLTEELGFAESFAAYWVRNTSVQIQFVERNQGDLLDKLKRHKIDIALARTDFLNEDWFDYSNIVCDEIVLVCPTDSPYAFRDKVRVSELKGERFVLLEEQSEITQKFLRACSEADFRPNAPLHHTRHRMLIKAIQHHMGISVLSKKLITTYHADDLTFVPFDKPLVSTLGFIWLRGEKPTPVAQNFMDFVSTDFVRRFDIPEEERPERRGSGPAAAETSKE